MSCKGDYIIEKQLNTSIQWKEVFDELIETEYKQYSIDFDKNGYPIVVLIGSDENIKLADKFMFTSDNLKNFRKIKEIGVWVNNQTNFEGNLEIKIRKLTSKSEKR